MKTYKKQLIWLIGCFALAFTLMTSTVLGGVAVYLISSNDTGPIAERIAQPLVNTMSASPHNDQAQLDSTFPAPSMGQSGQLAPSFSPQGDSSTVSAVERVLPAVMTVFSQGPRGEGSGSGFFISEEGYLVTNNHVIENGTQFAVSYSQGGTAEATLVGRAPAFDLAVLKVDGPVPMIAGWGDSSELPLGADVIAIGSALGRYQNTVTAGILSGFNRQLGELQGLLQTDAAINHGNSGGPLLNQYGEVIGINTMVVRGGRSSAEGLGFAIPSNIARNVVRHLIDRGEVVAPYLGVNYNNLNPQLATENGLSVNEGAILEEVLPRTPASQAKLQAGDVIVAVDSIRIDDRRTLVSLLLEHVAGETVTLDVLRDGRQFQTSLTLGERL